MSSIVKNLDRHRRRAERLDDPSFEQLRAPAARRRLSATVLGILALEAAVFVLAGLGVFSVWAFIIGLLVAIVVFVFAFGALKASTRGVEELPEDALDERHVQIRGQVYSRAYTLISWLGYALFALIVLAVAFGWELPMFLTLAIAIIALQLVIIAPTLVAALRHDA